jgi:imidazolonepropionase-like amidohydrolase
MAPSRTVIVGGNVIDAVADGSRQADVVIEGDRIVAVSPEARPAPSDRVIDVNGAFLLPGLWDAHTHLESRVRPPDPSIADVTLRYADQARQGLEAGVVAVRTGGVPHFIDVSLRNAIQEGLVEGPRIFAGGYFLTTTAGHLAASSWSRECDGPVGFVTAIREQIKSGVDHIKLNLSGGIMGPIWDQPSHSYWRDDELDAAFDIARLRGYPVMAHATNPAAVKSALRRGAHSVEHGYVMDEECIELFLQTSAWYVPTLCISHLTPTQATSHWERAWVEERNLRPDLVARADAAAEDHRRWFQRALGAGVKMALGSDAGPIASAVFQEMELWVKDGATPMQVILAATRNAAELCGVLDETGTLEAGKRADLIVVAADPLRDINNIRSAEIVIQSGRVVADRRRALSTGAIT